MTHITLLSHINVQSMFLMQGRFNIHDFFLTKQVSGRNLMAINARDVYAYGLALIDILFTKQEMTYSLFFDSGESDKNAR